MRKARMSEYLMGGINFTDMACLTGKNIEGERLVYVRQSNCLSS